MRSHRVEENAQQVRFELAQHSLLPNVDVTCVCVCDFDCDVVLSREFREATKTQKFWGSKFCHYCGTVRLVPL